MSKPKRRSPISDFLSDMEPFFYKRPITYADIGANRGETFEAILDFGFWVNRVLLAEANPGTFERLQETVAAREIGDKVTCLNIALSDRAGTLRLRDMSTMSTVVEPEDGTQAAAGVLQEKYFEVEAQPFEAFAEFFPDGHVSILKIDVEGHEAQVLRGAEKMLTDHAVDVIYIEAGMNPDNSQQTYYRTIEDILRGYGYNLFRIYEQKAEWIEDRATLRRINMAFMSPVMTERYPLRLTQELFALRRRIEEQEALVAEKERLVEETRKQVTELKEALKAADAEAQARAKSLETVQAGHAEAMDRRFEEISALTQAAEENDTARKQAVRTSETLRKQLQEARGQASKAKGLEERIARLERSTSWRVTAPLRWMSHKLGRH